MFFCAHMVLFAHMIFTDFKCILFYPPLQRMGICASVKPYIEDSSALQEETNILQESMEEGIDESLGSLDEKDDEVSEEQKEEERISYPWPPSNESNSSTHTLFNFPSFLPKDDCYDR